jgi:hypothetical protein
MPAFSISLEVDEDGVLVISSENPIHIRTDAKVDFVNDKTIEQAASSAAPITIPYLETLKTAPVVAVAPPISLPPGWEHVPAAGNDSPASMPPQTAEEPAKKRGRRSKAEIEAAKAAEAQASAPAHSAVTVAPFTSMATPAPVQSPFAAMSTPPIPVTPPPPVVPPPPPAPVTPQFNPHPQTLEDFRHAMVQLGNMYPRRFWTIAQPHGWFTIESVPQEYWGWLVQEMQNSAHGY